MNKLLTVFLSKTTGEFFTYLLVDFLRAYFTRQHNGFYFPTLKLVYFEIILRMM
jgi:hypothetical protein